MLAAIYKAGLMNPTADFLALKRAELINAIIPANTGDEQEVL